MLHLQRLIQNTWATNAQQNYVRAIFLAFSVAILYSGVTPPCAYCNDMPTHVFGLSNGTGSTAFLLPKTKCLIQMNYQKQLSRIKDAAKHIDFVTIINSYIYEKETCFYCERKLTKTSRSKDHVIPRMITQKETRLQFRSDINRINLVHCCKTCNQSKSHKSLSAFRHQTIVSKPANYRKIIKNIDTVLYRPPLHRLAYALRNINYLFTF